MNNTTKTTARCARCNRPLRSARALRTGYGPCYTMVRAAARRSCPAQAHQVAKAVELLEDGGVVPTTRTGVYYTVGTKGEIYKTARRLHQGRHQRPAAAATASPSGSSRPPTSRPPTN